MGDEELSHFALEVNAKAILLAVSKQVPVKAAVKVLYTFARHGLCDKDMYCEMLQLFGLHIASWMKENNIYFKVAVKGIKVSNCFLCLSNYYVRQHLSMSSHQKIIQFINLRLWTTSFYVYT